MARAHFVQKARKNYPDAGIKKGESYWWWKPMIGGRGGAKRYSKTRPRESQLTQSEYLSSCYSMQEDVEDSQNCASVDDVQALLDLLEQQVDDFNTLGDEQEEKKNNLPDSLQNGASGELLDMRAECCREVSRSIEEAKDQLSSLLDDIKAEDDGGKEETESAEDKEAESFEERWQEKIDDIVNGIDWTFES